MWIDGASVGARSGETLPVENPATESVIGTVPRARTADVTVPVEAARRTQPAWRRVPGLERGRMLHDIGALMRSRNSMSVVSVSGIEASRAELSCLSRLAPASSVSGTRW
jgi:acyl-CoA reductase-like NAD-dependent aldehyde dehydrogenase